MLISILLFTFLVQTFSQGWYYIGYIIEKKEYVKRCVNKAKLELHCNGKCQLVKKIKEQGEKEQAPEMKNSKVEVLSSLSFFPGLVPGLLSLERSSYSLTRTGTPVDFPTSLFHPPGHFPAA